MSGKYCCPYICEKSSTCDVSNEADILSTIVGQSISHCEDSEMKEDLISINTILFHFMSALRQNVKITEQDINLVKSIKNKYDEKIVGKVNCIFTLPAGSILATTLQTCRAFAKKVSRMYAKLEVELGIENEENTIIINMLSNTFYSMSKHANIIKNIEELEYIPRKN